MHNVRAIGNAIVVDLCLLFIVGNGPLQCRFCPEVEKLFLTNGSVSGLRKDLNGILLLDSILQPPLEGSSSEEVVLEVTLSDVSQFVSFCCLCHICLSVCDSMSPSFNENRSHSHSDVTVSFQVARCNYVQY